MNPVITNKNKVQLLTEAVRLREEQLRHFVKFARIVEDDKGGEMRELIEGRRKIALSVLRNLSPLSTDLAIEYASAQAVADELEILLDSFVSPEKRIETLEKEIGELRDRLSILEKQGKSTDEF